MVAADSKGEAAALLSDDQRPEWFRSFLADRATRKPSARTLQAYRRLRRNRGPYGRRSSDAPAHMNHQHGYHVLGQEEANWC
ncbi:hypothetical protein [Mycobacterium sp.]|uniref:hypothetical protein n=1 Tax=Mycobacterium sp. TaxID=1785 RepID=UPI003BAB0828